MNTINQILNKNNNKFELVKNNDEFLIGLNSSISKIMNNLWENPEIIVSIIKKANPKYLKNFLSPLFIQSFYNNILSTHSIDNNLIYIITLLLKSEIDNLDNNILNNKFLDESPCSIIFEELRKKKDIQNYFKNIMEKSIINLEEKFNLLKIDFDREELIFNENSINYLKKRYEIGDKLIENKRTNLIQKYMMTLDKTTLLNSLQEYKNNKNMYDYLYSKISLCENDNNIFSNLNLLNSLQSLDIDFNQILNLYQYNFIIIVNFIDEIIKNISDNLNSIPYSIKCISKIIIELIHKKFPKINILERNSFIAKFFFGKILIPFLQNPNYELFMNHFISENTLQNLKIISMILNKFVSSYFFISNESEFNYCPFNIYFMDNFEKILKIFKKLNKTSLPSIIENIITNKLPFDFRYNYFTENPEEILYYRSIFFNLKQVSVLIDTMNNNSDVIFKDGKNDILKNNLVIISKKNNLNFLKELIESEDINKKNNNENEKKKKSNKDGGNNNKEHIIHYFLVTSIKVNPKYENLFNIKRKLNFSINELKSTPDNKSKIQNNIIRTKNMLSGLLNNIDILEKSDFDEQKIDKTENILNQLPILLKSQNEESDNIIPPIWYLKSLINCLRNLPDDLKKNDYEKLYNELERNINQSINELKFEILSTIFSKIKYARRKILYYKNIVKNLKDFSFNKEVTKIINEILIPINIKFQYNENEPSIFEIKEYKLKAKNSNKEKNTNKNKKYDCNTIKEFTENFPNLTELENLMDVNIFDIQKRLKFPEKLNEYMQIIEKKLKMENILNLELIKNKINEYIMRNIYEKIFRIEPLNEDNKIFQKSYLLSWVELKHFLKLEKELLFGNFEQEILEHFNSLEKERYVNHKFNYLNKIFDLIELFQKFNGLENYLNIDGQIPIFRYSFIKAQEKMIYTNMEFMELYKENLGDKFDKNKFEIFKKVCAIIPKFDFQNLINISKEEYIEKNRRIQITNCK